MSLFSWTNLNNKYAPIHIILKASPYSKYVSMSFLLVSIVPSLFFYDITLIKQNTQIISMHSFHLITQKLKIQVECKQLDGISERIFLFQFAIHSADLLGASTKKNFRGSVICVGCLLSWNEPSLTKKVSNFNGNLQYIEYVDISFERPKTKKNLYCKLSHLSIVSKS